MSNGNLITISQNENNRLEETSSQVQNSVSNFEHTKQSDNNLSTNQTKISSNLLSVAQIKTIEDKIESKDEMDVIPTPTHVNQNPSPNEDVSLSKEEIDLLARIVRAEAQTEPMEGKVAVARVVLNRVKSPQFPNTVKEVIYQRNQFQPVMNGEINMPADKESFDAVNSAILNHPHIADEALFFYNPEIATSRWLDSRETIVTIGQHVFKR
jgi:N-acetylmuramoyl-L-alanine amidase